MPLARELVDTTAASSCSLPSCGCDKFLFALFWLELDIKNILCCLGSSETMVRITNGCINQAARSCARELLCVRIMMSELQAHAMDVRSHQTMIIQLCYRTSQFCGHAPTARHW